jgi:glycosyltransferase involved in cell wall biosynthesis
MSSYACSVVIPSHNRAQLLDAMLAALAAQLIDVPFEVIVVLDGCTDESAGILATWKELGEMPSLRWIEQPRSGQALARNVGAFAARAPVIVFLDDDVIPDADLLAIHLAHHAQGERIAVLGDYEVVRHDDSLCTLGVWSWWEDTYHRRASAWQPQGYRDFCTGNVSVRKEDFANVGGFDQDFTGYGGEDYEIGYRLLRAGVRFVPDRRVRARHFCTPRVRSLLRATRQEAHGDVTIARKHPELIGGLRLGASADKQARRAARLAMRAPWLGDLVSAAGRVSLRVYERLRRRGRWQSRFAFLRSYAYWRGVRDASGSRAGLRALVATAVRPAPQTIDVAEDIGPQVQRLRVDTPGTLVVTYRAEPLGAVEIRVGLEEPFLPWLVREISSRLSASLLIVLAREHRESIEAR